MEPLSRQRKPSTDKLIRRSQGRQTLGAPRANFDHRHVSQTLALFSDSSNLVCDYSAAPHEPNQLLPCFLSVATTKGRLGVVLNGFDPTVDFGLPGVMASAVRAKKPFSELAFLTGVGLDLPVLLLTAGLALLLDLLLVFAELLLVESLFVSPPKAPLNGVRQDHSARTDGALIDRQQPIKLTQTIRPVADLSTLTRETPAMRVEINELAQKTRAAECPKTERQGPDRFSSNYALRDGVSSA